MNPRRHVSAPRSKSGLRGVYFCRNLKFNPWKSYIRQHGQYITIGYYPTKEEAAKAFNAYARKIKAPYLNPIPKR